MAAEEKTFKKGDRVESLKSYEDNGGAPVSGVVHSTVTLETGHQGLFVRDHAGAEWWLHAQAVKKA